MHGVSLQQPMGERTLCVAFTLATAANIHRRIQLAVDIRFTCSSPSACDAAAADGGAGALRSCRERTARVACVCVRILASNAHRGSPDAYSTPSPADANRRPQTRTGAHRHIRRMAFRRCPATARTPAEAYVSTRSGCARPWPARPQAPSIRHAGNCGARSIMRPCPAAWHAAVAHVHIAIRATPPRLGYAARCRARAHRTRGRDMGTS